MTMGVLKATSLYLYIWISLVLYNGPVKGNSCREVVRYITHTMGIQSRVRPNIQGEWTSSGCEARPGPKFLTRYIRVYPNSSWVGRFHHYSDVHCSKPSFTLYIKGYVKMGKPFKPLEGSTGVNFNFTQVQLYPHTQHAQSELLKKSCPNSLTNITNNLSGVNVYRVSNRQFSRRSCRKKLGLAKYELLIVKLDKYKGKGNKHDLLYFAEIPNPFGRRWRGRPKYSPKSYQLPLKRSNAPNCTFCNKVKKSTSSRPHSFPKKRPLRVILEGEWGSSTCETRPGSFLTRYMIFDNKRQSFRGYFHYFKDPYCKKIDFMISAKGSFNNSGKSFHVKDGENFVFTVNEASITPYINSRTRQLNSMSRNNECGNDGEWETGVATDITSSKGCRLYSISLPHTEYDLLKIEENGNKERELYLGQRFSDGTSPTSPESRPTSYQIPLVKCSRFKSINFVPPTPEPTPKPSTRYPRPPAVNPILTVPTLKRDGEKTTPKQGNKNKGTKGSSTNGSTVMVQENAIGRSQSISSTSYMIAMLLVLVRVF